MGFDVREIDEAGRESGVQAILQWPVAKIASDKNLPQAVAKIASAELLDQLGSP